MPGGRPTKYDPSYCDAVIECMAEGHSVTAFAGRIGVARSTVFLWADEHAEFSDALKVGQARATEFWENIVAKIAKDGGGNATAAIFGLKNRAADDWSDRVVQDHTGSVEHRHEHRLDDETRALFDEATKLLEGGDA